ncbi:MAG: PrsW family glutamic-type intramembrane protease [bacterium]|nr:PrsW family glutamic-type intramembrane protease [bacterium]
MASEITYAALGGIVPALVWLLFWLREDRKNPEPNGLILKTFLLGMLAVLLVLPFQKGVEMLIPGTTIITLFLWAFFEESFKLGAGYFGGLHTVDDNEPLDPLIYMITAALGFVALENTLFILGPILGQDIPQSIVTGNLRFIGASLLHVVSSGLVGASLAFSFYQSRARRVSKVILALGFAIAFHTAFNWFILKWNNSGILLSFFMVWIGVVILLWLFEKAKKIARPTYIEL